VLEKGFRKKIKSYTNKSPKIKDTQGKFDYLIVFKEALVPQKYNRNHITEDHQNIIFIEKAEKKRIKKRKNPVYRKCLWKKE